MRADARVNRQTIIDCARMQIAAHGYNISLTTVATDAHLGIATLYRNFPTRQDLIAAVLEDLEKDFAEIVDRALTHMDDNPAAGWVDFVHDVAHLRPGAMISAFSVAFVTDDHVPDSVQAARNDAFSDVQRVLDQAKSAGLVRADLTPPQFQMGIASITRPLPNVAVPDMAAHEEWLIEIYISGLCP